MTSILSDLAKPALSKLFGDAPGDSPTAEELGCNIEDHFTVSEGAYGMLSLHDKGPTFKYYVLAFNKSMQI
jgi:hypothetical protein